jgi:hypothetical protein
MDGQSSIDALDGRPHDRISIFCNVPHYGTQGGIPGCSICRDEWNLIEFFEGGVVRFNLYHDPSATYGLSREYPELHRDLLAVLHAWQEDIHAINPKPKPDRKPRRDQDLNPLV